MTNQWPDTMQKVINGLALFSFGVSAVVVGSGVWVYANRYELLNDIKNIAADEIAEVVPGLIQNSLTESLGGPAMPGVGNESPVPMPSIPGF